MRNESWRYKALSHLHIDGKEGRHVDTASREFRPRRRGKRKPAGTSARGRTVTGDVTAKKAEEEPPGWCRKTRTG